MSGKHLLGKLIQSEKEERKKEEEEEEKKKRKRLLINSHTNIILNLT